MVSLVTSVTTFGKATTARPGRSYPGAMFDDLDNAFAALLLGTAAMLPWLMHLSQAAQR